MRALPKNSLPKKRQSLPTLLGVYAVVRILYLGLGYSTANNRSKIVAYTVDHGTGYRIYKASPLFLEKYSDMLPALDVHEWYFKADMVVWLESVFFYSFMRCSLAGVERCWFMKHVTIANSNVFTVLPVGYQAFLGGCDDSIWVLLKSGSRVWPVRIVDNVFHDGWAKFVREHAWSPKLIIVFGAERKWIFEVFVLDENHEQIVYPWTITGRALHNWHVPPG
ncbi:hypothetical protein RHMOL_Rhmol04G0381500 [Rhododendron molle]|uniref:Uncharacterized protein n=1 Tax=Rhododendron molle TaxID=49168 RepID=A0ACC0P9X0_RHOML|nr:hypothetical protein RHMOL_Rhmol04G0381500 [Rhododendron molle]